MKFKRIAAVALTAALTVTLASCTKDSDDNNTYTYNTALSVFPTNWNTHSYQTNTDSVVLDYTVNGFYEFDYNETKDGYKVVPAMAKSEPVDVTANYVGDDWGIESTDTGRAYKIDLRDDLKWEDGTAITAEDFVESAKLLLNPQAQNYRADSLYSGSLVISNSKNYLYQGKVGTFAADSLTDVYDSANDSTLIFSLAPAEGDNTECSFRGSMGFPSSYDAAKVVDYLQANYLPTSTAFTDEVLASMEGKTFAEIKANADMKAAWDDLIGWWQTEPNEELDFFVSSYEYPEVDFSKVGVKAVDGDLVLILEKELSGFYLLYSLSDSWLVNTKLYKSLETTTNGLYNNTYGTSVDTYMSYGPYKLSYFQADKQIRFERNEFWYGYNDESDVTTYQTTNIQIDYVAEESTRLNMFNKGELDVYGLSATDMATYGQSDYLYYTEGPSTFFIALNPDLDALTASQTQAGTGKNKTILTIEAFRQALSFAVDRSKFCLAVDPMSKAATGVFNSLIVSDPENGTAYRTNEEAKDVLLAFWGLTDQVGEGKRYATKDEAIASITGVDLAQAKTLFNTAYDQAIAAGLLTENDTVELKIGIPNGTSNFYNKGLEYLQNCWTDAVKGTKLEGKLVFTSDNTLGNGFADALRDNKVDILFGVGWTGSALDPYNLAGAYTLPRYQYDDAINYADVFKDINFDSITDVNGTVHTNVTLRASIDAWSNKALAGETITATIVENGVATQVKVELSAGSKADLHTRTLILCAVEAAILEQYTMLPLNDEASASLKGMQIKYYTEEYIYGVGRGGIKYMTYNYSDSEWADFVASNNNSLKYN